MKFEKDYYIGGQISNYDNYFKKTFKEQATELINYFNLNKESKVLDYGCASGGLIKELKNRGIKRVVGTDISMFAIEYGKEHFMLEKELHYYNRNLLTKKYDLVVMLDVLEHMCEYEIEFILKLLSKNKQSVLLRVPVSKKKGKPYVLKVSRNDKTHLICEPKNYWIGLFKKNGFELKEMLSLKTMYDSKGVLVGVFENGGK